MKSVVRIAGRPDMKSAVYRVVKQEIKHTIKTATGIG